MDLKDHQGHRKREKDPTALGAKDQGILLKPITKSMVFPQEDKTIVTILQTLDQCQPKWVNKGDFSGHLAR